MNKDGTMKSSKYSMNSEALKFHMKRVCYCHEYIGDGTKYPFTMDIENAVQTDVFKQLSIFDLQGGFNEN